MVRATRTINPLHFEDLEPHRFEDLVRQLFYDFRTWQSLEPTGRLGADEGFDIRAVERSRTDDEPEGEDEEEDQPPLYEERIWQIQCKREREITPKKIGEIVAVAIPSQGEASLPYGFVLAAACDFSKKSRDRFRSEMVAKGVQEFHLWGKADLEDMLFRPENDHLLFAYFNVSLAVRKRSLRSQVRSVLAMKRKAVAALGDVGHRAYKPVLIRDGEDTHYPDKTRVEDFDRHPAWMLRAFVGHDPNGVRILVSKFFAYIADDEKHWDTIDRFDDAGPPVPDNPWIDKAEERRLKDERWKIWDYWRTLPEKNQATLHVERLIKYENIVDIDKFGDELTRDIPHIYVIFGPEGRGPYESFYWAYLEWGSTYNRRTLPAATKDRIKYFPEKVPEVKPMEVEKDVPDGTPTNGDSKMRGVN